MGNSCQTTMTEQPSSVRRVSTLIQHLCASSLPGLATGLFSLDGMTPTVGNGCWVAPTAAVIGNVVMHENSSVWFAAVVRGDGEAPITIGARTNIQDGAVLHSDAGSPLTIGSGVTVGHQAMLHGCTIGENTLIGIGATVLNGAVVGKNCHRSPCPRQGRHGCARWLGSHGDSRTCCKAGESEWPRVIYRRAETEWRILCRQR